MTSSPPSDTCRLTIVAPTMTVEACVPTDIPLAHLLPVLLRHDGAALVHDGMEHDGWILQRLGEEPIDDDLSAAKLGLQDGETLYLRTRDTMLTPFAFDDLIDGVATGINGRADRWHPVHTRTLFLALAGATALAGLPALLPDGPAAAGAALALLLAVTAAVASRSAGDSVSGIVLGLLALPYAGITGLIALGPVTTVSDALTAPRLLAAIAAVTATAIAVLAAVGDGTPLFLGVIAATGFGVLAGILAVTKALSPVQCAAIVGALAFIVMPAVPLLSFRLAKMQLPPMPTSAAELQDDIEPLPSGPVLARTAELNRYVSALLIACGTVCGTAAIVLSTGSVMALCLGAMLVLCMLLRSRIPVVITHRLALIAPATLAAIVVMFAFTDRVSSGTRLSVLAAVPVSVWLLLLAANTIPGRRLLPHWGRAADIGETMATISLAPLVLAVLNIYHFTRGIGG
jgi:type VII secretion integral membrane protein EccD